MKIKILKKENEVSKVEIDAREYKNISKVEIKNKAGGIFCFLLLLKIIENK